jgi:hypothetical protein
MRDRRSDQTTCARAPLSPSLPSSFTANINKIMFLACGQMEPDSESAHGELSKSGLDFNFGPPKLDFVTFPPPPPGDTATAASQCAGSGVCHSPAPQGETHHNIPLPTGDDSGGRMLLGYFGIPGCPPASLLRFSASWVHTDFIHKHPSPPSGGRFGSHKCVGGGAEARRRLHGLFPKCSYRSRGFTKMAFLSQLLRDLNRIVLCTFACASPWLHDGNVRYAP